MIETVKYAALTRLELLDQEAWRSTGDAVSGRWWADFTWPSRRTM